MKQYFQILLTFIFLFAGCKKGDSTPDAANEVYLKCKVDGTSVNFGIEDIVAGITDTAFGAYEFDAGTGSKPSVTLVWIEPALTHSTFSTATYVLDNYVTPPVSGGNGRYYDGVKSYSTDGAVYKGTLIINMESDRKHINGTFAFDAAWHDNINIAYPGVHVTDGSFRIRSQMLGL